MPPKKIAKKATSTTKAGKAKPVAAKPSGKKTQQQTKKATKKTTTKKSTTKKPIVKTKAKKPTAKKSIATKNKKAKTATSTKSAKNDSKKKIEQQQFDETIAEKGQQKVLINTNNQNKNNNNNNMMMMGNNVNNNNNNNSQPQDKFLTPQAVKSALQQAVASLRVGTATPVGRVDQLRQVISFITGHNYNHLEQIFLLHQKQKQNNSFNENSSGQQNQQARKNNNSNKNTKSNASAVAEDAAPTENNDDDNNNSQKRQMMFFLQQLQLEQQQAGIQQPVSIIISNVLQLFGMPGTGKTAIVKHSLNVAYQQGNVSGLSFVFLNGFLLEKPGELYCRLWQHLSKVRLGSEQFLVPEAAASALEQRFRDRGWPLPTQNNNNNNNNNSSSNTTKLATQISPWRCIIIIDEVDKLNENSTGWRAFFRLLEWLELPHCHCRLITMSNSMQLPDAAKTRSRVSTSKHQRVVFTPYHADELRAILLDRVKDIVPKVFNDAAVEYICKQIASQNGDVRRMLQTTSVAIHEVLSNNNNNTQPQQNSGGNNNNNVNNNNNNVDKSLSYLPIPETRDSGIITLRQLHSTVRRVLHDRLPELFHELLPLLTRLAICTLCVEAERVQKQGMNMPMSLESWRGLTVRAIRKYGIQMNIDRVVNLLGHSPSLNQVLSSSSSSQSQKESNNNYQSVGVCGGLRHVIKNQKIIHTNNNPVLLYPTFNPNQSNSSTNNTSFHRAARLSLTIEVPQNQAVLNMNNNNNTTTRSNSQVNPQQQQQHATPGTLFSTLSPQQQQQLQFALASCSEELILPDYDWYNIVNLLREVALIEVHSLPSIYANTVVNGQHVAGLSTYQLQQQGLLQQMLAPAGRTQWSMNYYSVANRCSVTMLQNYDTVKTLCELKFENMKVVFLGNL